MDIGDVRDPDLIGGGRHQAAHQIGDDEDARWSLRRWLQERRLALRKKIVFAHEPQDFLGIHDHALAPEGGCHPPIAVKGMLEANALELVAQLALGRLATVSVEVPVIGCARQTRQAAEALQVGVGIVASDVMAWMTSMMRMRVCLALPAAPMRARLAEKNRCPSAGGRPAVRVRRSGHSHGSAQNACRHMSLEA